MEGDASLGELLKRLRSEAGLTQEELAERAEVSARTISDTERGLRTSIYKDTTKRIADALGLTGDDRLQFEHAARGRHGKVRPPGAPLPVPPTTLIGREPEVAETARALDAGRLVTLTGPGGIGKTRIALEVAHRFSASGDARAHFVQLGAIEDPTIVASSIAHAIGVTWAPSALIPAIAQQLQDALLVLDTFERVLDAATDVAEILSLAPAARILVTSREALHIRGEHELPVSPLPIADDASIEALERAPATALFVERAQETDPTIALEASNAETIAAICRKLEGVPLAIELAAARAKHLPLLSLLHELEHSLNILTGGSRDLPERQRAMRDTVAWSEGMLDGEQRSLFHELSVFAGGWTLDAAAAVCTIGKHVLTPMSALVDKSLVRRARADGEPRYAMLDVIREYAAEGRGASPEIEARHADYFLGVATRAEAEIGSAEQESTFARLGADQANLRAALRFAIETRDAETALRLCGSLWQFWRAHGDGPEGRDWLRRALALEGGSLPTRAKALWGAAWLAYHQDDYEEATTLGRQLGSLAKTTSDPIVRRNALTIPGIVAMARAQYEDARDLFKQAVDVLQPLGANWLFATSLLNLGSACVRLGDGGTARGLLEQARDLYERLGDRFFAARASIQLAFLALLGGEREPARALIGASLLTFAEREDPWGTAEALEASAALCAAEGRAHDAAVLAGAAESIRSTIAMRPHPFDAVLVSRFVDEARASVDPATWRAWSDEGATIDIDRIVEIALGGSHSRAPAR